MWDNQRRREQSCEEVGAAILRAKGAWSVERGASWWSEEPCMWEKDGAKGWAAERVLRVREKAAGRGREIARVECIWPCIHGSTDGGR